MNQADRQQAMEIYSSTMSIMGGAAGQASNYKSTTSEYTGQTNSADWSGSVDYSNQFGDDYQIN
jgi:hypothetical protein